MYCRFCGRYVSERGQCTCEKSQTDWPLSVEQFLHEEEKPWRQQTVDEGESSELSDPPAPPRPVWMTALICLVVILALIASILMVALFVSDSTSTEKQKKNQTEQAVTIIQSSDQKKEPAKSEVHYSIELETGESYFQGDIIRFSAVGDGMDNSDPASGDERFRPITFELGAASGEFDTSDYSVALQIADNCKPGQYTLVVHFEQERFENGQWKPVGNVGKCEAFLTVYTSK